MAIKEKTIADIADEMIKDITSNYYNKIEVFNPTYSYISETWYSPDECWCEPGELFEVLRNVKEVEDFIDNYSYQKIEYYEDGCLVLWDEDIYLRSLYGIR